LEELFQLILKTYGVAGVLILLPVLACIVLWGRVKELQTQLQEASVAAIDAQKARVADQNKRVEDTERMMGKLLEVVREQTSLNTEVKAVLERLSESVDKLERHALNVSKR
jgi:methyl-accepting chemotaxis protein